MVTDNFSCGDLIAPALLTYPGQPLFLIFTIDTEGKPSTRIEFRVTVSKFSIVFAFEPIRTILLHRYRLYPR